MAERFLMFQVIWTHVFSPQGGLSCWSPNGDWGSGATGPGFKSWRQPMGTGAGHFPATSLSWCEH